MTWSRSIMLPSKLPIFFFWRKTLFERTAILFKLNRKHPKFLVWCFWSLWYAGHRSSWSTYWQLCARHVPSNRCSSQPLSGLVTSPAPSTQSSTQSLTKYLSRPSLSCCVADITLSTEDGVTAPLPPEQDSCAIQCVALATATAWRNQHANTVHPDCSAAEVTGGFQNDYMSWITILCITSFLHYEVMFPVTLPLFLRHPMWGGTIQYDQSMAM